MAVYSVPKELKTTTKIYKGFDLTSVMVVLSIVVIGYLLSQNTTLIYSGLIVPFNIFNIAISIIMLLPSPYNRGKRMYHSLLFLLLKDKYTYHSVSIAKTKRSDIRANKLIKSRIDKECEKYGLY